MTGIIETLKNSLTGYWMTGPIFHKELRVASRQKRFYALRSIYLVLLMALMSLVWIAVTDIMNYTGSRQAVYYISRMSEASKIIATATAWFQFIAAQLVTIVICSTAINSEIYNRTLYVLMTTPITALQIIGGKLISRLWQIFILVGISLPLLAMMRVFGGIPWSYLIESLCLTLCTVFFISAVSIFYSIFFKRAYVVVIFTVITLGFFFALIPFILIFLAETTNLLGWGLAEDIIRLINPYFLMTLETDRMFSARYSSAFSLPLIFQCSGLITTAFLILWITCCSVRKIALKHMTPVSKRKKYKIPPRESKTYWLYRPFFLHTIIQRTIGTGMIWKEFLHPVLGRFRKVVFIALILLIVGIAFGVLSPLLFGSFELFGFVIASTIIGSISLAILFTIIIPATYITSEKESGTWIILLTTCYSDAHILGGKIIGILRRILIVWSPFLLIYYVAAYFSDDPVSTFLALIFALIIPIGFVIASGLYFSSRFRHSTTAVICNLVLMGTLWIAIPLVLLLVEEFPYQIIRQIERSFHIDVEYCIRLYWCLTPPGMILNIFEDSFDSLYHSLNMSMLFPVYICLHILMTVFYLWRAKVNLRKRIF